MMCKKYLTKETGQNVQHRLQSDFYFCRALTTKELCKKKKLTYDDADVLVLLVKIIILLLFHSIFAKRQLYVWFLFHLNKKKIDK